MVPYTSCTGTRSTLEKLKSTGWRLLVSATGKLNNHGMNYGIDNGAFSAFMKDEKFDVGAFEKTLDWASSNPIKPDWCILPDIVGDGKRSLEFSMTWLERVRQCCEHPLLAVQNGVTPEDIKPLVGSDLGIFIGGTTDWKLETLLDWGKMSRNHCYMHVGRVNTKKRILLCQNAGADSFDGTRAVRFPKEIKDLDRFRNQLGFVF